MCVRCPFIVVLTNPLFTLAGNAVRSQESGELAETLMRAESMVLGSVQQANLPPVRGPGSPHTLLPGRPGQPNLSLHCIYIVTLGGLFGTENIVLKIRIQHYDQKHTRCPRSATRGHGHPLNPPVPVAHIKHCVSYCIVSSRASTLSTDDIMVELDQSFKVFISAFNILFYQID